MKIIPLGEPRGVTFPALVPIFNILARDAGTLPETEKMAPSTFVVLEGQNVKLGDYVGFKDGVEQSGKLVAIRGTDLTLRVWDSEEGEHYEVVKSASRCWKE
jgi:hypothetical protein